VFDDIADRNYSGKPAILDNGNMSELSCRHPLHEIVYRIAVPARCDRTRHHLFNWFVAKLTSACGSDVVRECSHNISFRQNAFHALVGASDHHGPDPMRVQDFYSIKQRRCGRDRYNVIAFAG
jgi:hypothetical protein